MSVLTAEWLKEQLDAERSDVVVLDVTWYCNKDASQDFLQKHIPGAQYFNIMKDVDITDMFPRNIPDPESFELQARSVGVSDDSHVVVYDNTPFCGYFVGGRAWWMFKLHGHDKVSILDGGLKQWEESGYPVIADVNKPKLGNFNVKMNSSLLKSHDDMVNNLQTKYFQVCDTRPPSDYHGKSTDPKTGHYPGAISIPLGSVLLDREHNRLQPIDKLKGIFQERAVDINKPIVGMCKCGMSSCTLVLAATLCGAKDVAVYLGGFTEWSMKASSGQIEQESD